MRYRLPHHAPKQASKREQRIRHAFNAGLVPDAKDIAPRALRGPQPEGETNKAIAKWAALHPELLLGRNKRRLATPPGMKAPIMLGWLIDGSADWIGYRSVLITPAMVGRRIAQFVAIEAKRPDGTGVVSDEQERFLNALKDAGGVAIVACSAEDCEGGYGR